MVDSCWPIRHELPMKMKPIKLAILSIFGATQLTVENYQIQQTDPSSHKNYLVATNHNKFLLTPSFLIPPHPLHPLPCSSFLANSRCRKIRSGKRP